MKRENEDKWEKREGDGGNRPKKEAKQGEKGRPRKEKAREQKLVRGAGSAENRIARRRGEGGLGGSEGTTDRANRTREPAEHGSSPLPMEDK